MSDNPIVVMEIDSGTVTLLESYMAMSMEGSPGSGAPPEYAAAWAEDYLYFTRERMALQTTIKARLFLTALKVLRPPGTESMLRSPGFGTQDPS